MDYVTGKEILAMKKKFISILLIATLTIGNISINGIAALASNPNQNSETLSKSTVANNQIAKTDTASAKETSVNPYQDYKYSVLTDNTIKIIKYTGTASEIIVPISIDGHTVSEIGEKAFYDDQYLMSITVPKSINKIGDKAIGYNDDYQNAPVPGFTIYSYDKRGKVKSYADSNHICILYLDKYDEKSVKTIDADKINEKNIVPPIIPKEKQKPTINSFTITYTDSNGTKKTSSLLDDNSEEGITIKSGTSYSFEVKVDKPSEIKDMWITAGSGNAACSILAKYDQNSDSYKANGPFNTGNPEFAGVPGNLSIETTNTTQYNVDAVNDIDSSRWDNIRSSDINSLDQSVAVSEDRKNIQLISDISDLRKSEGKTLLKTMISIYDSGDTSFKVSDIVDNLDDLKNFSGYVVKGVDNKRYEVYGGDLLNTDPSSTMMIIKDLTDNKYILTKFSALEETANKTGEYYKVSNIADIENTISITNKIASLACNYYDVQNDTDELKKQIQNSNLSEEKKEELNKKAEDLDYDRKTFSLMTTFLPILVAAPAITTVPVMPGIIFSGILGVITASSEYFWNYRMGGIKQEFARQDVCGADRESNGGLIIDVPFQSKQIAADKWFYGSDCHALGWHIQDYYIYKSDGLYNSTHCCKYEGNAISAEAPYKIRYFDETCGLIEVSPYPDIRGSHIKHFKIPSSQVGNLFLYDLDKDGKKINMPPIETFEVSTPWFDGIMPSDNTWFFGYHNKHFESFSDCTTLKKIDIPEGVRGFSDDNGDNSAVFSGCTSLEEVSFPSTYLENCFGESMFENCTHLKKVILPKSLTIIPTNTFKNCASLEKTYIPNGVTNVWDGAFYNCKNLKEITIPDSVIDIGINTFYNCSNVKRLHIGKSLKELSLNTCTNPSHLHYHKPYGEDSSDYLDYCSLDNITVSKENTYFKTDNDGSTLYYRWGANDLWQLIYCKDSVASLYIPRYSVLWSTVFDNNKNLRTVYFDDTESFHFTAKHSYFSYDESSMTSPYGTRIEVHLLKNDATTDSTSKEQLTPMPTVTETPRSAESSDTIDSSEVSNSTDINQSTGQTKNIEQTSALEQAARDTLYRLYNPNSGEHFYTVSAGERNALIKAGWRYEGTAWNAPESGFPVYRVYNPNSGDHHYTISVGEKNSLIRAGWRDEGIGWYAAAQNSNGAIPVYRQYNPNAKTGAHNFTINKNENDYLVKLGWRPEGIAWYALK